jgi:hypothetical protein
MPSETCARRRSRGRIPVFVTALVIFLEVETMILWLADSGQPRAHQSLRISQMGPGGLLKARPDFLKIDDFGCGSSVWHNADRDRGPR